MLRRIKPLLLIALCFNPFGGAALADTDFEFNAKGFSLRQAVGRTLVGVTRDGSKTWSLYMTKDGKAEFNYSTGGNNTGSYKIKDKYIVCFKGLVDKQPQKEVCKRAEASGRGLDWMSIDLTTKNGKTTWGRSVKNEANGSSQMVYSFAGRADIDQSSYVSDVTKWAGHVIVGRTLKDKEAWSALLALDGSLDFVFGSGKRFKGRYSLAAGEVCLTFPDNPGTNGCRKPTISKGKILWASSAGGDATSEIVFMKKIDAEGPRRIRDNVVKSVKFFAPSPDFKTLVANSKDDTRVTLFDAETMGTIGRIKSPAVRDMEFDLTSTRFALVQKNGVEVFDLATGAFLQAIPTPPNAPSVREVVFLPDQDEILLGDQSGALQVVSITTGEVLRRDQFGPDPIANMVSHRNGMIGIGDIKGKIGVVDTSLAAISGLEMQAGNEVGGMIITPDGRYFVTASADDYLYMIDLSTGSTTPTNRVKMPTSDLWSVENHPAGNKLVVGLGKHLGVVSLPGLGVLEQWKDASSVRIGRAAFSPDGEAINFVTQGYFMDAWAPNSAAAQRIQAALRNTKSREQTQSSGRRAKFKAGNIADLERLAVLRDAANAAYVAGQCVDYQSKTSALRLMDRREDCAGAAVTRKRDAAFAQALADKQCDVAEGLALELGRGQADVQACKVRVRRAQEMADYVAAKDAGNCEVVRLLAVKFKEPEAGADCDLQAALAGDNPRVMFLTAVRLDTEGDKLRARQLYLEVMSRFPEDDLAIDAANRLTSLADLATLQQQQAVKAAEDAAAIKAAEARAAAAERAAKRAADDAEKQRRAREAEARRADQARRDADAAQREANARAQRARQQAQRPRNDPACDRVYIGMEFKGGMFGVFRYRVQGMNPVTGRVTIRERQGGTTQEIRCSQVP